MASRVALPKIPRAPRIAGEIAPRAWADQRRRSLQRQMPRGEALRQGIWRVVTAPYWIASDVPAPRLPHRDAPLPPAGLAGDHVGKLITEIGRRIWLQRTLTILARSAWLGLLAGLVWLIVEILGGPALDLGVLLWIAVGLAIPGLIFAALVKPSRRQTARMLDRSFGLQERMTTALENLGKSVPNEGERASMTYLQIADAANVVTELRRYPAFAIRPPVREVVMAIICALAFAALFFACGVGADLPATSIGSVPPFSPASERIAQQARSAAPTGAQANAPTVAEVQARADRSNQARQDLNSLAQALKDHPVTNSAAESISQGDYASAADQLRDLAEDAADLSQTSRNALAQDLENAASSMSEGSQGLADASRQAAQGLRQGEEAAQEGVRNLGDAVEQTGNEVVAQDELAEQMQQAEAAAKNDANSGSPGSQSQSPSQGKGESSNDDSTSSESANGADQSGEPGEAGDSSQDSQSGDSSQSSESGDSAEAPPSESGEAGEAGQSPGESSEGAQPGQPQEGAGQPSGQPSDQGETGQSSAGQAGESGESGDAGQQSNNQPGGSKEGGAGSNSSPAEGGEQSEQTQQGGAAEAQSGETPAEPNVSNGTGEGGPGQETEEGGDPRKAVSLTRSENGESVRTSVDNGGSNVGSGQGVSVSSGTSTQGEVGAAGPDSNSVPEGYRSIVEDYFSEPGGP